MKISLIIPTAFTPEPYFSNCMKRVDEETKGKDFEVIISEDGPIPEEMRKKYPQHAIVLKHEEPSGCGLARKRAQEICTGDVVNFLDSDDLMIRGYYELIKDAWERYPDATCIEFGFNNVYPNGHSETVWDVENTTYGNFKYEMVWNKSYNGIKLREATKDYNPPLMMTPAEDLLWNTVYQTHFNQDYVQDKHLLLDRIVRKSGLAHSTAADVRNRINMMQYSLDVAKTISVSSPIYTWMSQYTNDLEVQLKASTTNCSGYRWNNNSGIAVSNPTSVTVTLLNQCNEKCSYCANENVEDLSSVSSKLIAEKLDDALSRWNKLYGLSKHVCLTGGEPTLLNPDDFIPIFNKYPEVTFHMYTNGYNLKSWHDIDNLVFRLHCISGLVNPEWLEDSKIEMIIYVGDKGEKLDSWKKLNQYYYKVYACEDINKREIDTKAISYCKQVEGNWIIDLTNDTVKPCCGTDVKGTGTIENRPHKSEVCCDTCKNASDNFKLCY